MSDPVAVDATAEFIEDERIQLALALLEVTETLEAGGDSYSAEMIQEATKRVGSDESGSVKIEPAVVLSEALNEAGFPESDQAVITDLITERGMLLVSREELGKVVRDIDNDRRILALQRVQALMGPDPV